MNAENQPISVSEMLRTTGTNTSEFMGKVAEHIDKLESALAEANALIEKLQSGEEQRTSIYCNVVLRWPRMG